jgi:hypothetical protein
MTGSGSVPCDLWIVFFLHLSNLQRENCLNMNRNRTWPWCTGTRVPQIAFLILVLVAAGLTACSRSPSARIEDVLNRCAEIGRKASGFQMDEASKAHYIAASFQEMDVSGCPEDFRVAFQEHVNAWQQFQMAAANNNVVNNVVVGAVSGITNDPSGIGQLQGAEASAQDAVNQTYYRLTEIAAQYGARIPRSVVQ